LFSCGQKLMGKCSSSTNSDASTNDNNMTNTVMGGYETIHEHQALVVPGTQSMTIVKHEQQPRKKALDDIWPSNVDQKILPVEEHLLNDHRPTVTKHKQRPRKKVLGDIWSSGVNRKILLVDEPQNDYHPTVIKHKQPRKEVPDDL